VLGGFLAELILIAFVIPSISPAEANARSRSSPSRDRRRVRPGRVVAEPHAPAAYPARRVDGAVAAALYIVLAVVGRQFKPTAPPMPFIYYVAHVLKIAGGVTGGWLAQRSAASVASSPAATR
jgi:hypothetical protein